MINVIPLVEGGTNFLPQINSETCEITTQEIQAATQINLDELRSHTALPEIDERVVVIPVVARRAIGNNVHAALPPAQDFRAHAEDDAGLRDGY